jgi:N-acylglucosamine 2-epimerase
MSDAPRIPDGGLFRTALLEDCLPFWFPRCVDERHGGFLHCLDRDGTVIDTDKSVWAQGRMAWMLLTLHNTVERRPEWLAWAEGGLRFLDRHCFDADGRMFFHVTREGRPIRKRRYAYSEAFAAIAFAAHARATGSDRSAARARELFERFTRWNFTPGLMPPKFTDTRPLTGLGPRLITLATAQELRFNLGDDAGLESWIDRCLGEIERLFVKPELECVLESVAPDGSVLDHFDGRLLNPGHALEAAWFILHEARHRQDDALLRLGCRMLDWMWQRGWDEEHGGLFYYRDLHGLPVQEYWHDMKFWWPHCEAIIATALAAKLTGEARYADWHRQVCDWSFRHFADKEHGEWFGYLHRDGRVSVPLKGNLWKSFFHLPRMLWYCSQMAERADIP